MVNEFLRCCKMSKKHLLLQRFSKESLSNFWQTYTFQVRHSASPVALLIVHRRTKDPDFMTSCASHFIDTLVDPDVFFGPTALVIVTALATEFSASFSTRAPAILSALAARLKTCPREYTNWR